MEEQTAIYHDANFTWLFITMPTSSMNQIMPTLTQATDDHTIHKNTAFVTWYSKIEFTFLRPENPAYALIHLCQLIYMPNILNESKEKLQQKY